MPYELLKKIDDNKKRIDEYRPFSDNRMLTQIQDFYRVDMTYSSNAIEGYGYTLSETKILIEDGLTAGGKPLRDAYAVVGHAKAYDYMFKLIHNSSISKEDIFFMHSLLNGSLSNSAIAGQYRNYEVFITGSEYNVTAHDKISQEMDNLLSFIEKNSNIHPIILAAKFHKYFVFIHPFGDGNGRIARLCMNTLLIQQGFLPVIIPPVLRHDYILSLEEARRNDSDFIKFIARCEYETQKDFLRMVNDTRDEPSYSMEF